MAAVVLVVVLLGGVALVTVLSDSGPRRDTQGQLREKGGAKPHIIVRPNSGVAPTNPGDRGGWEQLALFGVLGVAIVGIGVAVFRSGGRARAGRRAWNAAAATGRDGAIDEVEKVTPTPQA